MKSPINMVGLFDYTKHKRNNTMDKIELRNLIKQKYAWPGGYPLFALCADGGILCADCCIKESDLITEACKHPDTDKQWEIEAVNVNWESKDLRCDHCSNYIESAYE